MKVAGISHWSSPNIGADNSSGFTALPGGGRAYSGYFGNIGEEGNWWSSTAGYSQQSAWSRNLRYDRASVRRLHFRYRADGASVRCVRD